MKSFLLLSIAFLFLVSCDSDDIFEEYKVLIKELKQYNPELLEKRRILGISKCDMIDTELEDEMRKDLNKRMKGKNRVPVIFFSSASHKNIDQLKDLLWEQLNA